MTVPDFLIWRCAGCDAKAEGKKKPCDCATNVGLRNGPNGKTEQTWWDKPSLVPDEIMDIAKIFASGKGGLPTVRKMARFIVGLGKEGANNG